MKNRENKLEERILEFIINYIKYHGYGPFIREICFGLNISSTSTVHRYLHYMIKIGMIETEPTMSVSKIVNLIKSHTTYHIWERYPNYLRKHFWKERTFWTDGYFACSVGKVSEEMLRKYIENQG